MSALLIVLPISLVFVIFGLIVCIKTIYSNQYDDMKGDSHKIIEYSERSDE